jgi:hypothetical protein
MTGREFFTKEHLVKVSWVKGTWPRTPALILTWTRYAILYLSHHDQLHLITVRTLGNVRIET